MIKMITMIKPWGSQNGHRNLVKTQIHTKVGEEDNNNDTNDKTVGLPEWELIH